MKKAAAGTILALLLVGIAVLWAPWSVLAPTSPSEPPSLVLLTLDTTRSDYLGAYGDPDARTPTLDDLARRGVLYQKALTSSPLTLPAHASLLTGLDPPAHGLLDNGTQVLDSETATLASILSARGYSCAAFVSSRVLDRRFGLERGFETYDDSMTAERVGEYGYPERDAAAVTSAALDWLAHVDPSRPYFLWVHYYDPHLPYQPPAQWRGDTPEADYSGEIAFVDSEIGPLLAALPKQDRGRVVAVVGDHGESLGEHGERSHGIFLYRAALEVPLILQGVGIPEGSRIDEAVGTRRLAATLLKLTGAHEAAAKIGPYLPGLPALGGDPQPEPVYSATWLPANAYGWSPLRAFSDQRWRFVLAPRRELYDYRADPEEASNLIDAHAEEARRLEAGLSVLENSARARPDDVSVKSPDPELLAELRSLGYLSGSPPPAPGTDGIDAKDGVALLAELERAKRLVESEDPVAAAAILRDLTVRNPGNVPFWTNLAQAELEAGNEEAALTAYRKAIELNPRLDFLHLNLADAYRRLQLRDEARREYEVVLDLNPRSARAALALAELASTSGETGEERRVLLRAVEAGASSALIRCRLGQIEAAAGDSASADFHFQAGVSLAPEWALPWVLWGENAEAQGQFGEAIRRYSKAALVEPSNPAPYLRLGSLHWKGGDRQSGRRYLEQAVAVAPESGEAAEARRLLGGG